MKPTAVEWLANELYEKFEMKGDGALFNDLVNQAIEMEAKQIENAFDDGWERANKTKHKIHTTLEDMGSNYYNKTFNK
jgi:hypothetical protein